MIYGAKQSARIVTWILNLYIYIVTNAREIGLPLIADS